MKILERSPNITKQTLTMDPGTNLMGIRITEITFTSAREIQFLLTKNGQDWLQRVVYSFAPKTPPT